MLRKTLTVITAIFSPISGASKFFTADASDATVFAASAVNTFSFRIPVYDNMPSSPCDLP